MSHSLRQLLITVLVGLVGLAVLVLCAGPAAADDDDDDDDPVLVLTGDVFVPEDARVGDVAVGNGDVAVDGTVDGGVVVGSGDVVVRGRVTGSVAVFDGRLRLDRGAVVEGDTYTDDDPVLAAGARIEGDQKSTSGAFGGSGWYSTGRWVFWFVMSVSTLVLGLLFLLVAGRWREPIGLALKQRPGGTILFGILTLVGLPVLVILLLVTIVALPLGLALLGALFLYALVFYTVGAYTFGRLVLPNAVLAMLAGWAVLRLLALIPFVGALFWVLASIAGAGALWTARRIGLRPGNP